MLTSRVVGYDEVEFHQKELEYGPDADVERWGRRLGYQTSYLMQKRADLSFIAPFDDARVDEFTHSWFQLRELSEHAALAGAAELLAAIRGDEGTKKLGRIPNLLTMMALIWRIEAHLPNGRALLCHKISEAYLYTIDRWKRIDPRSERLEDRRRWLARVGFEMQRIRGSRSHKTSGDAEEVRSFATSATVESAEIFATGEQVRGWIAAAMKDSGRTAGDAEAAQFVDYLQRRTGLLLERGENRYSFLHLSFQEYFAAWHLKEQIVLPEWIDDEQVDLAPGTSKQALQEYAASPVWRETLVFLIELLAVEQPRWLKRVRKCLFGPDYAIVTSGNDGNQEQTMLLARLANDPQAGFTDDDRWRAIGACCGWEAQRQKNLGDNPWGGSPVVLPVLLSCEPMQRTRIVECLVACLLEVDAEAVTIEFTPFSDLTPLGKLQNLRILDLDSTLVSDLTGLSGLANLQKLILDHTSVSDLTPLSDLATLQVITLQVTPVSDLTSLSRLASLEWLDLSDTPVSDLTPLSGLASLRTLVLRDTPVSEESVAALQNARNQAGLPEISHVIR